MTVFFYLLGALGVLAGLGVLLIPPMDFAYAKIAMAMSFVGGSIGLFAVAAILDRLDTLVAAARASSSPAPDYENVDTSRWSKRDREAYERRQR